ncbi:MAG: hypothetical protein VW495_11310 [Rhodobiaceae bacterium]
MFLNPQHRLDQTISDQAFRGVDIACDNGEDTVELVIFDMPGTQGRGSLHARLQSVGPAVSINLTAGGSWQADPEDQKFDPVMSMTAGNRLDHPQAAITIGAGIMGGQPVFAPGQNTIGDEILQHDLAKSGVVVSRQQAGEMQFNGPPHRITKGRLCRQQRHPDADYHQPHQRQNECPVHRLIQKTGAVNLRVQGQNNNSNAYRNAGNQTGGYEAPATTHAKSLDQRRDFKAPAGGKTLFGQRFLDEGQHPSVVAQVPLSRQVRRNSGQYSTLIGILHLIIALNVAYKSKCNENCDNAVLVGMPVHPFRAICSEKKGRGWNFDHESRDFEFPRTPNFQELRPPHAIIETDQLCS